MEKFEIFWRSAVLIALTFLAWNYFLVGGLLIGAVLLLCVPIWLYIGLYSLNLI